MKNTYITRTDAVRDLVLPPGWSLHLSDGSQIEPDVVPSYVERGEVVEIWQDGQRIGRFRLPSPSDQFGPSQFETVGRMIEEAKQENYASAVNWVDRLKDRFWCPVCEKNQSHPAIVSCWASPEGVPVCYYAICKRCAKQGTSKDEEVMRRLANLCEQRIVARYPHVAVSLPPGYMDWTNN
jgi:hypothetical protein